LPLTSLFFWDSIRIIKDKYYQPEDIKDEQLLYGAIEGAINSLGDPYSTFLNQATLRNLRKIFKVVLAASARK